MRAIRPARVALLAQVIADGAVVIWGGAVIRAHVADLALTAAWGIVAGVLLIRRSVKQPWSTRSQPAALPEVESRALTLCAAVAPDLLLVPLVVAGQFLDPFLVALGAGTALGLLLSTLDVLRRVMMSERAGPRLWHGVYTYNPWKRGGEFYFRRENSAN